MNELTVVRNASIRAPCSENVFFAALFGNPYRVYDPPLDKAFALRPGRVTKPSKGPN